MKRLIIYISQVFILFVALQLQAQDVTIKTQIDTNKIELGDQVSLKYLIDHSQDIEITAPEPDTLIEGVEVLGKPVKSILETTDDRSTAQYEYTITSFDEGMYYIPPQPFKISGELYDDTLFSKATYLEVVGVELDTTAMVRDIKPVEGAPVSLQEALRFFLLFIFIPLVVIVAFILLYIYIIRKLLKKEPVEIKRKPKVPAHVIALRELDKIKAEKLWLQSDIKDYYSRLTAVIRGYIERRFNIPALEQTTPEILIDFKSGSNNEQIDYKILEELLNLADLVKFAKGNPLPEENVKHLDNAYQFVKDTKQILQTAEQLNPTEE